MTMKYSGKFGGATGNFNAHRVAYPAVNWPEFADRLLNERLGLERQQITTQIEHYDGLAALFDCISRINTIITDLCRDIWSYISMDYFKQTIVKGEVGSSAMPHKVNPIDFGKRRREPWTGKRTFASSLPPNCRSRGCSAT